MTQCQGTTDDGDQCRRPAGWGLAEDHPRADTFCKAHVPDPDSESESEAMKLDLPEYDSIDAASDEWLIVVDERVHVRIPGGTYRALPAGYGTPDGDEDDGLDPGDDSDSDESPDDVAPTTAYGVGGYGRGEYGV